MKKRKVSKKDNFRKRMVDEQLVKLADDLVSSILKCSTEHMTDPTLHMKEAIYNYSTYRAGLCL